MRNLGVLLFCVAVVVVGWYVFVWSRRPAPAEEGAAGSADRGPARTAEGSPFTTAEDLQRSREAAELFKQAEEAERAGDGERREQLLRRVAGYTGTWAAEEAGRLLAAAGAGGATPVTPARDAGPQPEAIPDEPPPKPDTTYTVEPGDVLERIAKKLGVSVQQIKLENGKRDDTIHPGDQLKIAWRMPTIFVDKEGLTLYLTYRGQVVKSYPVGIGKVEAETGESSTPEGVFVIGNRMKNPVWFRPGERIEYGDRRNILGTRWMGFERTANLQGYGIHGTTQPGTVPGLHSEGCIRLRNGDMEELFEWTPMGTPVHVRSRWRPPAKSGAEASRKDG